MTEYFPCILTACRINSTIVGLSSITSTFFCRDGSTGCSACAVCSVSCATCRAIFRHLFRTKQFTSTHQYDDICATHAHMYIHMLQNACRRHLVPLRCPQVDVYTSSRAYSAVRDAPSLRVWLPGRYRLWGLLYHMATQRTSGLKVLARRFHTARSQQE